MFRKEIYPKKNIIIKQLTGNYDAADLIPIDPILTIRPSILHSLEKDVT